MSRLVLIGDDGSVTEIGEAGLDTDESERLVPGLEPLDDLDHSKTPDDIGAGLIARIVQAIENHPRSLQTKIGPSEIGDPCARKIAYKLLGHAERGSAPNWKATIGTATHAWLEGLFQTFNGQSATPGYYLERRVDVGEIVRQGEGVHIAGSCDLYERSTATVVDWKTCGPTQLKDYRANGPSEKYRVQAHLYGRGYARAGLAVARVMVIFLPRNGELREAVVWSEPYDESVAVAALDRLQAIASTVDALPAADALGALPTASSHCSFCPFLASEPGALNDVGCPGHRDSGAVAAVGQTQADFFA